MMPKDLSAQVPFPDWQVVAASGVARSSVQVAPAVAYPRRPPHFANLELLDPGDRAALEDRWNTAEQACPPILLQNIGPATIVTPGAVWLAGSVVTESLHNMHLKDKATLLAAGPPQPTPTTKGHADGGPVVQGPTLLLSRAGSTNYGHWLAEHLSALLLLRDALPELQPQLLVNDPRGPAMQQVFADSVRLAGFDPTALLPIAAGGTQAAELLMLSPASQHSYMKHPLALRALAELAPPRPATERLFVRRTSTAKRVLHNLDQIEAIALKLGFRIIEPGRMTLTNQIMAFAGARVVVGVSGADLANIVFMPKGGEVICLLPSRGREFFFWDICCIRQHRYWSVFGPSVTQRGGGHDDFMVDVELAASVMAQAVAAA